MNTKFLNRVLFKDIFTSEEIKPIEFYFKGVNKKNCLKVARFLITNHEEFVENPEKCLEDWFGTVNRHHIINFLAKLSDTEIKLNSQLKLNAKASFVNPISTLKFYEAALKYCNDEDTLSDFDLSLNLFKAYLILSTEQNIKDDNFDVRIELLPYDFYLINSYRYLKQFTYHEIINFNFEFSFYCCTIKSIEFFLFLEKDYKNYLDVFYTELDITDWRDYLKFVLPPMMLILNSENKRRENREKGIKEGNYVV